MQQGDDVLLLADVNSGKKTPYGKANDKVRIIFVSSPAVIVENTKGVRYPTSENNLVKPTQKKPHT